MLENSYLELKQTTILPRLPLEGNLDLTYRCNNNCRHCWLRIPSDSKESKLELSFAEIKKIAHQARSMGCRSWSICGGEPMLRLDFSETFDYLTRNFNSYSINTNGTLITPKIARLLKRKGAKMIALYGATAQVHDHITRNPGSFEATVRGFRYLKEAGARFIVQLIPMKDNYHQFQDMVKLAGSLSKHYRVGVAWLYLSACGDKKINTEIMRQRLSPKEVVELDKPDLSYEECMNKETGSDRHNINNNGYLFSSCIADRQNFHIDPYGKMTFCCFIKDPDFRYDLKKGSFQKAWEEFIPSLANKIKITEEYARNCGSCEFRKGCRWCSAYAYLEHRRFDAKIEYLCAVARESRNFKEAWQKNHRRYYKIADITIQVDSDLPITEKTFHHKFKSFEVDSPEADVISIRHHFSLPDLDGKNLGEEFYRKPPWLIYKNNGSWVYLGISPFKENKDLHRVVTFNSDHTRARIYNDKEETFLKGNLHSLTLFPTDQILLARILADRGGFFLHSCGVNLNGEGLLFAGHSEAGKSTMARIMKNAGAEILCDDRIIVRKTHDSRLTTHDSLRIYGTWSHGDVADISSGSAPLKAIMFLEKANENRLIKIDNKKEITKRLLALLIKPFVTVDWWEKTLEVIDDIAGEVTCYILKFDRTGKVVKLLK